MSTERNIIYDFTQPFKSSISFNNSLLNDLVSMLQKQISLEFLVVMLGYSIDNLLIVSWYMLVEE